METITVTEGTSKAPAPERDCERLSSRLQDTAKRLEDQIARLRRVTARLYSRPSDEQPDKQARGEGWIEDMDGAVDTLDVLIVDFGAELDLLNRFVE